MIYDNRQRSGSPADLPAPDPKTSMHDSMQLKILLPGRIFADQAGVTRIVAESRSGAFGILPNRLDCVAALAPGIFTYETPEGGEIDVAVDEGILVKVGPEVLVSVRNAIGGADLGELREAVERHFRSLDERERNMRYLLAKLESEFARRLMEYRRLG
jgi:F-type H+-transporting ATPase subunit epsilon